MNEQFKEYGIVSVTSPVWSVTGDGSINCKVVFVDDPQTEYPFTASDKDVVAYGRFIHDECLKGTFGDIGDADPDAVKQYEYNIRLADYSNEVDAANTAINNLKALIEEVELGITDDVEPSYKSQYKQWVIYRKALNEMDLETDVTFPDKPK